MTNSNIQIINRIKSYKTKSTLAKKIVKYLDSSEILITFE